LNVYFIRELSVFIAAVALWIAEWVTQIIVYSDKKEENSPARASPCR